jgi:pentatricopeptide repeat protein
VPHIKKTLIERCLGIRRREEYLEGGGGSDNEAEDCKMRSFLICALSKEDEVGGAYSMYGEMRNAYKIFVGIPEKRDQSKDLSEDVEIILG